ncbi:MAG: EI24 domain-containing protein [Bacteriovoracaceae bacterium]|nr:EI24 domain-containing protein [Bacteriovoracaceae bacterium]
MGRVLKVFNQSVGIIFGDKLILLFSLLPVIIGIALYFAMGGLALYEAVSASETWISSFFSSSSWIIDAVVWMIGGVVLLVFYFISSFTFILIVSLISCLFSDLISSRTEQRLVEDKVVPISESIKMMFLRMGSIIKNEIKKVLFIALLATIAAVCGLSGFLIPVSLFLSCLLIAIQFLDYSWCRHEMSFSECIEDLKQNILPYTISAFGFSFVFVIPILGLIFFPFAVVFFTTLFVSNQIGEIESV